MVAERQSRTLSGRPHPLRRRVDEVEAAIVTALVVAFVLAAPLLAIVTGRTADTAALREQRAEQSWRQVTAILTESASAGLIGLDGEWGAAFVVATWAAPDGGQRTGLVAVALNARAGQRVREWVTPSGQLTHPPLTTGDVRDRVGSAAIASVVCLAVLFGLAAVAVRAAAGRCRLAGWARAWEAADPRCSRQR